MQNMRAAAIFDAKKARTDEVLVPEMGLDEVQVRIDACTVCPTGIREY